MPPTQLVDLSTIELEKVLVDQEGIYRVNPHRHEFQQLTAIVHLDRQAGLIVGYRDVRDDEFWVAGHIPGRPIFPGVLMIEAAAQLVSYFAGTIRSEQGFLGFSGVDDVKFRGSVVPGQRIDLVGKLVQIRSRRIIGHTQGFVDGEMVFEARITGMWI